MAGAPRLRLCCFNVLAPSARICEPLRRRPWRERHEAICDYLLRLGADVVCLQEFDFCPRHPGFLELYQGRLQGEYDLHTLKRTGSKVDGLAVAVRRSAFSSVSVERRELQPRFCDRVAMFLELSHVASGRRLLIGNTHLTVAHASNDHDIPRCRPQQAEQVLQELERGEGQPLRFLCADMNCDHLEREPPDGPYSAADVSRPVAMCFERGLASALHEAQPPGGRPISHTCSYAQDGCVDYIFFDAAEVRLEGAWLHPAEVPPDTPWSAEVGWGEGPGVTLSDHRPLVADFLLPPCSEARPTL